MNFYTYIYRRKDGTPYYIGKASTRKRIFAKNHNVSVPKDWSRIFTQQWASEEEALTMEIWWIHLFGRKCNNTGVLRNLTSGGEGQSGRVDSKETRLKKSLALLGKPKSEEHRMNLARINTGKKHSDETRRKIGDIKRGLKQTPEVIARRVAGRAGYSPSVETRRKQSESNRGKHNMSVETRKKMSLAHMGQIPWNKGAIARVGVL